MLEAAIFVIFPFCMVYAAISDMLSMSIANRVSVILIATFVVVAPLTGMGWAEFGMHFAAFGLVLAVTFALFAIGGMGGGDAKLMASTALWMGMGLPLMQYLLLSTVLGGFLTLALVVFRNTPLSVYSARNRFLRNLADKDVGIPYGIALGTGALLVFPASPLVVWALQSLATG